MCGRIGQLSASLSYTRPATFAPFCFPENIAVFLPFDRIFRYAKDVPAGEPGRREKRMMEFGEKIKHLREDKGMTQQTMAEHLYVTRQAVSRWECGARYPDLLTTKKIAELLDTTIDDLVSGEEMNREIEKEPIITAHISNFIQTILYTIGVVSGLIMTIGWIYICIEPIWSFDNKGQRWVVTTIVSNILMFAGYGIYEAAMAAGIYYSVKGKLSPRRTGIIMSIIFLPELMSYFSAIVSCMKMISSMNIEGNISMFFVTLIRLLVFIIEVGCVINFFMIEKRKSPILIYLVALFVSVEEVYHVSQMVLYGSNGIGMVLSLSVSSLGRITIAGLLMYQAYSMAQKRKRA